MSYPNHYLMKKNRLVVLEQSKGKCAICRQPAQIVHHKDCTLDNHSLDNLIPVCHGCHKVLHLDEIGYTGSKLKRLYGLTIHEMVREFHRNKSFFYALSSTGLLADFLNGTYTPYKKPKKKILSRLKKKKLPPPKKEKTSKYIRLYGFTNKQISERLGLSTAKVYELHTLGQLKDWLLREATRRHFLASTNNTIITKKIKRA